MIKIHTDDGLTHTVDLSKPEEVDEWERKLSRFGFQSRITGVTLVENYDVKRTPVGVQFSVPRPRDSGRVHYAIERVEPSGKIKGGERLVMFVDSMKLVLMAHNSQPSARITLSKVGKFVSKPSSKG